MGHQLAGNRGSAIVESGFSAAKLVGPGLVGLLLRARPEGWPSRFPFLLPCAAVALAQFLVAPLVPADAPGGAAQDKLLGGAGAAARGAEEAADDRRRALHAQALSAGLVVASVAMEECFVLYGVGALDVGAAAVGATYLVAGAVDLLLQNTVLLGLIQRADAPELVRLRRLALALLALPLAGLPFAADLAASAPSRVLLLGLFSGLRTAISYVFFVANMSLLNDASPGRVAAAQSLRMAVSSTLQVVGPPLGASAYAWSATNGRPFPLDLARYVML